MITSFRSDTTNKLQKKWEKCSSLPPPENSIIDFLVKTRLLYSIDSYCNSSIDGRDQHAIQCVHKQHKINVEGNFLNLTEVMSRIIYDSKKGKMISKDNEEEIWSYGHNGLWKHDRFRYDELPPSLIISSNQYDSLLKQSELFWKDPPRGEHLHSCILQLITTQHQASDSFLGENWARGRPQHVTIRLIDDQRNVYSFGFERESEVAAAVQSKGYFQSFFTSSRVHIATPDYEDSYPSWKKIETPISISVDTFKNIKTFIEKSNAKGITFNFLGGNIENHANCMTLAREILDLVGVKDLPHRTNLYDYLFQLFPDLKHIPYAANGLNRLVLTIARVAKNLFSMICAITPKPIKKMIKGAIHLAVFIPQRCAWIFANTFIACCGGMRTGPHAKRALLSEWKDFIKEPLMDSHLNLIKWQKEQRSTRNIDSSKCVKFHGIV